MTDAERLTRLEDAVIALSAVASQGVDCRVTPHANRRVQYYGLQLLDICSQITSERMAPSEP